jgi:hypothetical protein
MLNYFLTSLPRAILGARGSYFKSVVGALDLCELAGTVPSFASVWLHNVKPNRTLPEFLAGRRSYPDVVRYVIAGQVPVGATTVGYSSFCYAAVNIVDQHANSPSQCDGREEQPSNQARTYS